MPLSQSPAATAFSWVRRSLETPSQITLLLIGASLPFLGALVGYAHQEGLADSAAREAQTVRNSQAANEVFIEISKRLSEIRLIEAEVREAETQPEDILRSKARELDSAAREWSLAYPRVRALAETYFGKPLGEYLDISDSMLRDERTSLPNRIELELSIRRSKRASDSTGRIADSITKRMTPAYVRSLPPSVRELLAAQDRKRDSLLARRKEQDSTIAGLREQTQGFIKRVQVQDATLYGTMATLIRDGKVGFTEEERARADAQDTVLGMFGIYPFDLGTFFWMFTLLAIAVIIAYRLAVLTGRNPWPWSVGAALAAAPVLLFLFLAPPAKPRVAATAEPEVGPERE